LSSQGDINEFIGDAELINSEEDYLIQFTQLKEKTQNHLRIKEKTKNQLKSKEKTKNQLKSKEKND